MGVFLDKFTSNLRAIQSQQIISILQKEKERGNITTVEEFQARLQQLTSTLLSTQIAPTLRLFEAQLEGTIDSETLNFMLERVEDDLNTAFNELDTIEEVLTQHETIINDVVLKAIEIGVNELDSRIRSFEFLAKTGSGFDSAEFNTFRITQAIDGDTKSISVLDPKSKNTFTSDEVCAIDLTGEKLVLGGTLDVEKRISSVRQIFDHEAVATELKVEISNNDINKVIDSTIGTFWSTSVLLSHSQKETGVLTKLELNLGSIQTIDYLEIQPILTNPVELIGIEYLDSSNTVRTVLSTSVEVKQSIKLLFQTIATSKLFLKFRNRTARQVQFTQKPGTPLVEGLREALSPEALLEFVSPDIREAITSPLLLSALPLPASEIVEHRYWEYFVGFDNIKVGLTQYLPRGVYISRALDGNTVKQTALRVEEKRPFSSTPTGSVEYTTDVAPLADDKYFHGSIEYYCYKLDYDKDGVLAHSEVFPLLPLGTRHIRHERLVLSERSSTTLAFNDIGFLQFFCLDNPQDTDAAFDPDAVRVYRNGTLLENADINISATDGWSNWDPLTVSSPDQSTPMRYAIQVQAPAPNDIYTVSYLPVISNTDTLFFGAGTTSVTSTEGANIVDLTGRLNTILGKNNIARSKDSFTGVKIVQSVVRLIVIMRRNSADTGLTPVLEEYLLVTGRGKNAGA